VIDSKEVSVLSTVAGVISIETMQRYSAESKKKVEQEFPLAFSLYNKFMDGVDIHDFRCKRVVPSIHSKKWTWAIFMRILQFSIVNAVVIWNHCNDNKQRKISTKYLCMKMSEVYLSPNAVYFLCIKILDYIWCNVTFIYRLQWFLG